MPKTFKPLTFLITAGPTIEDIDPVRFISNRSTGKLGVAIANAALQKGHAVILIHGPVSESVLKKLPRSPALSRIAVRCADDMHKAVMNNIRHADAVIMNAAVADYTPANTSPVKLKKSGQRMSLKLKPTVDILKELGALKIKRLDFVLIGFALETGNGKTAGQRRKAQLKEARRKLKDKNLDAIVLDSPHAMGADQSDFTLLSRTGPEKFLRNATKVTLAKQLVRLVALENRGPEETRYRPLKITHDGMRITS
jgi:phosphopantothenoylcysteine decarboxylase / phosphopantothenate---cysteine ligase